jgi:hypothetical protein
MFGVAMSIVSDALGLLGVLLLAVPVFYASSYARLLARARRTRPRYEDPDVAADRAAAIRELEQIRDQWVPWKSYCLIAGTFLAGLSYLLPLLEALLG